MDKILVVVDMQNDFIDGDLGTPEAKQIVPKVVEKIESFKGTMYFTMDSHDEDYMDTQEGKLLPIPHCIFGTNGFEFNNSIKEALRKIQTKCCVIRKKTFGSSDLVQYLRDAYEKGKFNEIEIVGLCTDICVISNAILFKAFMPEVKITVDASCCAGVTPESHINALNAMKMCQINIIGENL